MGSTVTLRFRYFANFIVTVSEERVALATCSRAQRLAHRAQLTVSGRRRCNRGRVFAVAVVDERTMSDKRAPRPQARSHSDEPPRRHDGELRDAKRRRRRGRRRRRATAAESAYFHDEAVEAHERGRNTHSAYVYRNVCCSLN